MRPLTFFALLVAASLPSPSTLGAVEYSSSLFSSNNFKGPSGGEPSECVVERPNDDPLISTIK